MPATELNIGLSDCASSKLPRSRVASTPIRTSVEINTMLQHILDGYEDTDEQKYI